MNPIFAFFALAATWTALMFASYYANHHAGNLITRLAYFGAALLWPITLSLAALVSLTAACYCAPIAVLHLWRSVRKAALAEAEEIQKS